MRPGITDLSPTNDSATNSKISLPLNIGRVVEVIIDEENFTSVGRIEINIAETVQDLENNDSIRRHAFPLDIYNYTLPMVGETVIIVSDDTGALFYSSVIPKNFYGPITVDYNTEDREQAGDEPRLSINNFEDQHFDVTDDNETVTYGTNVTLELLEATLETSFAKQLHEGDIIHQGRWGQSLRFSCKNELNETPWSIDGEDGQPVIALSLGEGQVENLTEDKAFIYLLSDQTLDYGDIAFSPEHANVGETMDAYLGSQVVIGSDRLTFVSKVDDISISSAGIVSIATPKWAVDLDVLMDQVKALATQLDALCAGKATLITGVGPTGVGTNTADCAAIVSEIEGMEQ